MKSRLVGFLKQATNRVSDWSFRWNAIACWFSRCRLLKNSVRLIPAENKRTQLCLQTELAEEKSQLLHSQKFPAVSITNLRPERKKSSHLMLSKSFVCRPEISPKYLKKLKSDTDPKIPVRHNSAPYQKFHAKSSTCTTTQKYIWD